ncbi:MAG: glutamyl-tRNA reductase [Candidatus Latescibacterota bacterium]|nr:glutamyl-tRNA reductase [Candidatus Latescibacterota bacterium]
MHLLAFGVNHTTASVEVRERLAFAEDDQPTSLRRLRDGYGVAEAAILSTCNRSEIYTASFDCNIQALQRFLAEERGVDLASIAPSLYHFADGEAAMHLFRVSCGVDSQIVGESQILGQVRDALETSQATGTARVIINELFQRALRAGKRARTETDIGRGRLSVGTAAVELASQIFDRLEDHCALLLGAGEMAELTAQYLVDSGLLRFIVANRTVERAEQMARRFSGRAASLPELPALLPEVDIVISSTAAQEPVIGADVVRAAMGKRRGHPLFLIDIAVPRDIDPSVREIDNVFLFDIDDLEGVVEKNRKEREGEIARVQCIVDEELGDFLHWYNSLGSEPIIRDLRAQADHLRDHELERWRSRLSHLSPEDRELVEAVLRGYANKLLHQPQVQIRKLANRDDGHLRLDTARRLFNLNRSESLEEEG